MKIKGIVYYPEHWDEKSWDEDLKRIKDMNVNTIRIGEFMWTLIEPKENEFSFKKLDVMVNKISSYGFKILIGTPTATFPSWVVSNYQNILASGRKYGTRRQYCYNSNDYLKLSKIITEKVVKRYSDNENVIGFQIDNEIGHEGSDFCTCDNCKNKFSVYLEEKYKTVENLNKVCGNIFWGQIFSSFYDVPIPFDDLLGHNPTLRLEYANFMSKSAVNYLNEMQKVVINNRNENQFITTNLPGGLFNKWFDANKLVENIDFVSFDNYPVWGGETNNANHAKVAMELDMIRGLKNQKFWIVEQLIGAQGHDYVGFLPRKNQAKLWAMQAHLRGAENIFFFRYKGLNKGEEQFCQGIFDVDNRINSKYYEVKSFFKDVDGDFNTENLKMENKIAMIYDYKNIWSWKIQPQSKEFDFSNEFLKHYKSIYDLNVNVDIISTEKDFDKYKILIIPNMQIIDDLLYAKIKNQLENGKTVIFGYRSGIRNEFNNMRLKNNILEDLIGAYIEGYEALNENSNVNVFYDNKEYELSVWRDILKVTTGESIIKYSDFSFEKNSCLIKNKYLNGSVYYFGASLPSDLSKLIYSKILNENNFETFSINEDIEMIKLKYKNESINYILNHGFIKNNDVNPVTYIRR
ncbi:beta-galactosidase [Clostridiaceae bacterium HSG29]|nr:beta-galactosidase [Clostridiaceae bacterium HSG29]